MFFTLYSARFCPAPNGRLAKAQMGPFNLVWVSILWLAPDSSQHKLLSNCNWIHTFIVHYLFDRLDYIRLKLWPTICLSWSIKKRSWIERTYLTEWFFFSLSGIHSLPPPKFLRQATRIHPVGIKNWNSIKWEIGKDHRT